MQHLTSKQIAEWFAFDALESFGEYRQEIRHGQMMALYANINRDSNVKREPFKAIDFMNFVEKPKEPELTPEQIERHLASIFGV